MPKMQDFILSVEELADAGLSLEEIAKRLNTDVPVIEKVLTWIEPKPSDGKATIRF